MNYAQDEIKQNTLKIKKKRKEYRLEITMQKKTTPARYVRLKEKRYPAYNVARGQDKYS